MRPLLRQPVLAALFLTTLVVALPVQGEPTSVTWLVFDQPPQFIVEGPDKGAGAIDGVMAYLQARLPGYNHQIQLTNIARALGELQTDVHEVVLGLVRTPERESQVLLSEPFTVALPPGILVRRANQAGLGPFQAPDGRVDLEKLLAAGRFTIGVAAGRSYGPVTDALLARYQDRGVSYTRFAERGILSGLVDMLASGRVDAVFVYRSEVRYVIGDEARLRDLVVLPVVPSSAPLTIHAAVPRTDWGRSFLQQLNPILVKARLDPEFRRIVDRWSDDETRAQVLKVVRDLPSPGP